MTYEEAKEEVVDFKTFVRIACDSCSNDWYCPSYCDVLEKASKMNIDLIINCYALRKSNEKMFVTIGKQDAEIEVLKKIQQKVLSEQGSYTTNDRTVCDDCERLWLDGLLKAKSEAYKEFAEKLFENTCVYEFENKAEGYTEGVEGEPIDSIFYLNDIDNTIKELMEG